MLFTLALLACTEVSVRDNSDPPVVDLLLPVMDGSFDPLQPVQVCAAVEFNGDFENLDAILVSDADGPLATDGFTPCEGGDLGIEVLLSDAPQVISLTVTDQAGRSSTDSASITPIPNRAPRCEILFPEPASSFTEGTTVDLTIRAEDDDGGDLEISVDSTLDGAIAAQTVVAGSTVTLPLQLSLGAHDLVVLLEDPRGGNDVCLVSMEMVACTDIDADGFDTCHGDCDDNDAGVFPGAVETANGQDDDCDGTVDEGTVLYDDDGDGTTELDGDCDDTDADIFPGQDEVTDDGIDQDCNGADTVTCFVDLDGDGHGSTNTALSDDGQCDGAGLSPTDTDCDDTDASRNPDAAEVPGDGIDQDCDGTDPAGCFEDLDLDGYGSSVVLPPGDGDCNDPGESSFGTDCNDADASIHPTADEILDDGIDQDCSNADRVRCWADVDLDGFGGDTAIEEEGLCNVGTSESLDCDDLDATIFPGAAEIADDSVDQDCSGSDAITCFVDADFDGFGDLLTTIAEDGVCNTSDNEAVTSNDCDDSDASIYPGAPEIVADGIDQDCDGSDSSDCFADTDGDGWGSSTTVPSADADCDDPGEANQSGDCDDTDADLHPGQADIPDDGIDQDCSGSDAVSCFEDLDEDSFGSSNIVVSTTGTCQTTDQQADIDGDCDDTDANRSPATPEINDDGIDQDCSGADSITCFVDLDGDGYGLTPIIADDGSCDAAQNEASVGGDCNDADAMRFPTNPEVPDDGIDQDCSGLDTVTCYTDSDNDGFGVGAPSLEEGSCGANLANVGGDCDDSEAQAWPGNPEVPDDGIDQDCSGTDTISCFRDQDLDGFGGLDVLAADGSCDPAQSEASIGGDCADNNPDRFPGNPEVPDDGVDQDCSGDDTVTCYVDNDADDYGVGVGMLVEAQCGATQASVNGDCDDTEASAHPGGTEIPADGIDQDCSGTDTIFCYQDLDGDSFGGQQILAADGVCDAPAEVGNGDDCDDNNPNRYPGNSEIPDDGVDQDCSGADTRRCYTDADGDSFGFTGSLVLAEAVCGPGLVVVDGDCDDLDPDIYPGVLEIVDDGIDQDCSGSDAVSCFQDFDQDSFGTAIVVVAPDGTCDTLDGESSNDDGDCDDADAAVYPGGPETRDAVDNNCDGRCDEGLIGPGDLVITELLVNPNAVGDTLGEWFEIYNTTGTGIQFCEGWTFGDDGGQTVMIDPVLFIPAGGYVVGGTNPNTGTNGNVVLDFNYPTGQMQFGNSNGDELWLHFDAETLDIDHIAWTASFDAAGKSQQLSDDSIDATANDDTTNSGPWCDSTTMWPGSTGDSGSPGMPNALCP